jgi:hypothetical protein
MKPHYKLGIILILLFQISCCRDRKPVPIEEIKTIKEWTGKIINLSDYTISNAKKYRILLYLDSTVDLLHPLWEIYIREMADKVDFLFYTSSHKIRALPEYSVHYSNCYVYIDTSDKLNKLNKFPVDIKYRCFLMDKTNKVLALGNPAKNTNIWELYKKIITGELSDKPPVTTIEAKQTEIELKNLQVGKTSETVLEVKNTGTQSLVIQQVESSCGCTIPDWEKQPVKAGRNAKIKVRITPQEKGYLNKIITVYCNIEKGQISFLVKGTVE